MGGSMEALHFKNFCICCTLQSGVMISVLVLSTIFIGMVTMTSYTITVLNGWTSANVCGLALAFGHALFVIIAIYVAFLGAYKEDAKTMLYAAFIMMIAFLIYIAASIISFIPDISKYACVLTRCPDHVWMENSYWRSYYFYKEETYSIADEEGISDETRQDIAYYYDDWSKYGEQKPIWKCRWEGRMPRFHRHKGNGELLHDSSSLNGEQHRIQGQTLPDPTEMGDTGDANNTQPENPVIVLGNPSLEEVGIRSQNQKRDEQESPTTCKCTTRMIIFPLYGLVLSIFFNLLYAAFLVYTMLTYLAYGNDLGYGEFQDKYDEWMNRKR